MRGCVEEMNFSKEDTEVKSILEKWASLRGHDRCWWYPEYIEPIARSYGLSLENLKLRPGSMETFNGACERFIREQYIQRDSSYSPRFGSAREEFSAWVEENKGRDYTYHDAILQKLAIILNVSLPKKPCVSKDELQLGCARFQSEQYPSR